MRERRHEIKNERRKTNLVTFYPLSSVPVVSISPPSVSPLESEILVLDLWGGENALKPEKTITKSKCTVSI